MFLIFMVISCDDDRSGNQLASEQSSTKFPEITENSQYIDSISVAINDSYMSNYPDGKKRIQYLADGINIILDRQKDNKKQVVFDYDKIIDYKDENIYNMFNNGLGQEYLPKKEHPSSAGTELIIFVYNDIANKPELYNGKNKTISNFHRTRTLSNGKRVEEVWIFFDISNSPLTNIIPGTDEYEEALRSIIHELGHAWGLADEELFSYSASDLSNILPNIGNINPCLRWDDIINDPMFSYVLPLKFSEFDNWLINKNADYTFSAIQITEKTSAKILVRVLDRYGNPVSDVSVKNFAVNWGSNISLKNPPLLSEAMTDSNGEVVFNSHDLKRVTYNGITFSIGLSSDVPIWMIKADYNHRLYAGCYITLYDLEKAYLQDEQDTFVVELTLEYIFP